VYSNLCFTQDSEYNNLIEQVSKLQENGKADEATILLKKLMYQYPEKWFYTSKKLIRLNEGNGKFEDNIKIFTDAHNKGFFYFIHPMMPRYNPYKDLPGFSELSERDLELRDSAINISSTRYIIEIPDSYDPDKSYPVIFIFHGGGSSLSNAKTHWQVPAINMNYIKVYLQSYRHFDSKSFGWGTGDSRLDKEIADIYRQVKENYNIMTDRIYAGGISAGATAAIDISLRNIIPASGIIAWCPDIPYFIRNRNYDDIKNKVARIFISSGESDHFRPRQESMVEILDSLGLNYKYHIESSRGHEYPLNEELNLNQALKFILCRETLVDQEYEDNIYKSIKNNNCRGLAIATGNEDQILFYNYGRAFTDKDDEPHNQLLRSGIQIRAQPCLH